MLISILFIPALVKAQDRSAATAQLPAVIPVFPLPDVTLFPHSAQPFHIFEQDSLVQAHKAHLARLEARANEQDDGHRPNGRLERARTHIKDLESRLEKARKKRQDKAAEAKIARDARLAKARAEKPAKEAAKKEAKEG